MLPGDSLRSRRDRVLLHYALLSRLDESRVSSSPCTHHDLEHRLRSNWKTVDSLLSTAVSNGWVSFDNDSRTYQITDRGREYRATLERAIAPIYSEYVRTKDLLG